MELQTLQEALKVEIQVHQVIYILSCFKAIAALVLLTVLLLMGALSNSTTTIVIIVL